MNLFQTLDLLRFLVLPVTWFPLVSRTRDQDSDGHKPTHGNQFREVRRPRDQLSSIDRDLQGSI